MINLLLYMMLSVMAVDTVRPPPTQLEREIRMIYRPYKTQRNPITGKKERVSNGKGGFVRLETYYGQWIAHTGKRKTQSFSTSKAVAVRMLEAKREETRQIRCGFKPVPSAVNKNQSRRFRDVADEWLAWGKTQGGHGGRPWAPIHQRSRERQIDLWETRLKLKYLNDLDGCVGRVSKVIQDLTAENVSKKSIANTVEGLKALVFWCLEREYLSKNPLRGLGKLDKTPKIRRRDMTLQEIRRLLEVAPEGRRMTYRVAMETGLRANELRHLQFRHLDAELCGVHLEAAWTKNHKDGFQPISKALLAVLIEYARARSAEKEYKAAFRKGAHEETWPANPLIYVPRNCATTMDRDLAAAGIPKLTADGKVDFHALRTVYVNILIKTGADVKTVQSLARHSTPELSFNTYGRSDDKRLVSAVEEASRQLCFGLSDESEKPHQASGE